MGIGIGAGWKRDDDLGDPIRGEQLYKEDVALRKELELAKFKIKMLEIVLQKALEK